MPVISRTDIAIFPQAILPKPWRGWIDLPLTVIAESGPEPRQIAGAAMTLNELIEALQSLRDHLTDTGGEERALAFVLDETRKSELPEDHDEVKWVQLDGISDLGAVNKRADGKYDVQFYRADLN